MFLGLLVFFWFEGGGGGGVVGKSYKQLKQKDCFTEHAGKRLDLEARFRYTTELLVAQRHGVWGFRVSGLGFRASLGFRVSV